MQLLDLVAVWQRDDEGSARPVRTRVDALDDLRQFGLDVVMFKHAPSVKIVVASSNWSSNLLWGDGFDDDKIHKREGSARAQSNGRAT